MVGSLLWLLGFEGSTTVWCFGLSASLWRYSGVLNFLLGGVEEAGSSWWVGLAAGVLVWLLPAQPKRKSSVPGLW